MKITVTVDIPDAELIALLRQAFHEVIERPQPRPEPKRWADADIKHNGKRMLSVSDAAQELGLSKSTLWAWIGSRKIAIVKLGRRTVISSQEIERLITEGSVPEKDWKALMKP